jgi:hypothetical protein
MPSSAHFFYIPMMILVGVMIGFILGTRAARNGFDLERKRDAERAEARARREARKQARQAAEAAASSDAADAAGKDE